MGDRSSHLTRLEIRGGGSWRRKRKDVGETGTGGRGRRKTGGEWNPREGRERKDVGETG